MKIKEVSEITDLTAVTLRYYEKSGLIPSIQRKNGIRNYTETDIEAINFIKCMRAAGLSVKSLVKYMDLFNRNEDTTSLRKQILATEQQKLKKQIAVMQKSVEIIDHKLELYDQGAFKNVH
ncbi:hypothetical protein BGL34_04550 [Fructilactobacillus lindneri]|uniref:HTH merR-type domain-containing protein n=2 Tax=Fructilactobacillus lindneri TaxID=53444 RepID=A0A0R2JLY8_9LACO|nr:MerR family transcriptional regulator [Fructilactobacillus lindneri]ANZ57585.1 hypothetical protein AYR60_01750 [Fructilactobacillus lindneri]ANZ58854.1 hypothetical protein AYR59_01750 [Fructilactobacillus lindneri]KRN78224.1 hypothetical protein IV52_GL001358 [Fructilactobacillus lindneri DSM 20690 = JCM 11027]POG97736.1 hypothetical protein BGL31_05895 [Fructilactobacillus lindneri]POH00039.1 hypothetical protein BGL32_04570 [Fructilactobacillus lindneri]